MQENNKRKNKEGQGGNSLVKRIERQLGQLSRSEKRVAQWIIENVASAVDASISEVAEATQVSQPTVIRFCRSMGMTGFRDLRTHLIAAMQRPDNYLHNDVAINDDTDDAVVKVVESSIRALVDLRTLLSGMPFQAAIDKMVNARQLIFVGLGASGYVARDACHKFFRLGIPCSTALDSQTILQQSAIARSDEVYVVISHVGEWAEMVDGMRCARDRGATIIALTDPVSSLAKVATWVFDCHPPEDTNVFTPMSSRLAQLTLLDVLQIGLALELGEQAEENLKLTKQALFSKWSQDP